MSVRNNCLNFSNFEIPILKYLKKSLPDIFQTSSKSVKFSFVFFCSKYYESSIFVLLVLLLLKEGDVHM
jgi:hypothetical protein